MVQLKESRQEARRTGGRAHRVAALFLLGLAWMSGLGSPVSSLEAADGVGTEPGALGAIRLDATAGETSVTGLSGAMPLDSEGLRVRVMIDDKHNELNVSGLDLNVSDATSGASILNEVSAVRLRLQDGKLMVADKVTSSQRVWVSSPVIFLTMNQQEYRGPLEVRITEDSNGNKHLAAILHLALESYLLGVVPGEMPSAWPMEALKAQVVVARTYAWMQVERSRSRPWDITSDTRDQVYLGANAETLPISLAVSQTQGIVLTKDDKLAQTFYHSTCGGSTEIPQNVWPTATSEFPSVQCDYCRASTHFSWQTQYKLAELATLIKAQQFIGARVTGLEVQQKSESGRALQVEVTGDAGKVLLDGNTFRKLLGYGRLKSTRFSYEMLGDSIKFSGQGFGHGAGMCQWGARGMALDGKNAEEILGLYYPGTVRVKLIPAAGEGGQFVPADGPLGVPTNLPAPNKGTDGAREGSRDSAQAPGMVPTTGSSPAVVPRNEPSPSIILPASGAGFLPEPTMSPEGRRP